VRGDDLEIGVPGLKTSVYKTLTGAFRGVLIIDQNAQFFISESLVYHGFPDSTLFAPTGTYSMESPSGSLFIL